MSHLKCNKTRYGIMWVRECPGCLESVGGAETIGSGRVLTSVVGGKYFNIVALLHLQLLAVAQCFT